IFLLLTLSFPSIFIFPIKKKTYHKNFKYMWYFFGCCIFGLSICLLTSTVFEYIYNENAKYFLIFSYVSFGKSFFHRMHRLSLICLFIERFIATKYCNIYEKKIRRVFPFFLSIICFILCLIWILLSNKNVINGMVNILLHISALTFSVLGTVMLLYQNKKLEKDYKRKLTERYIIKDNIRIAKFILPKLLITNLGETILLLLYVYCGMSMKKFPIARGDVVFYCLIIFGPILWNIMIITSNILVKLNITTKNNHIMDFKNKNEGCVYFSNLNQQWKLR
uniref:Uncharacterized protein n=2 Tax=Strongyloides stercoralis TaxID=6248 RepID=A0AAF5DBN7_STRER